MDDYLKKLKLIKEDFMLELDEYLEHTSLNVLRKNFNLYFKEHQMNYDFNDFILYNSFMKNQLIHLNILTDITNDGKLADNENIYVIPDIITVCPDYKKICDKCGYYVSGYNKTGNYYIFRDMLREVETLDNVYFHLSSSDNLCNTGIIPKSSKPHKFRNKAIKQDNYDERIYLFSLSKIMVHTSNYSNYFSKMAKDLDAHYLYSVKVPKKYNVYKDHASLDGVYIRNYIRKENINFIGIV